MEESLSAKFSAAHTSESENDTKTQSRAPNPASEQKRRRRRGGGKLKQNRSEVEEKRKDNEETTEGTKGETVTLVKLGRCDAPHRQQLTNLGSLGEWKEAYLELRRLFPELRVASRENAGQIATLVVLYCLSQGHPENDPAVVKGKPVVYEKCDICGKAGGQGDNKHNKLNKNEGDTEEGKEVEGSSPNTNTALEPCPECSTVACTAARLELRQILAADRAKDPNKIFLPCRERHLNYLGDWKEAFLELRRLFSPRMAVSAKKKTPKGKIYTLQVSYCGDPPEHAPTLVKGKPVVYKKGTLVDSCGCGQSVTSYFGESLCLTSFGSNVDMLRSTSALRWGSEIGDSRKARSIDALPGGCLGAVNMDRVGLTAYHIFVDSPLGFRVPPTAAQLSGDIVTAFLDEDIAIVKGRAHMPVHMPTHFSIDQQIGLNEAKCHSYAKSGVDVYKMGWVSGLTKGQIIGYDQVADPSEWDSAGVLGSVYVKRFIIQGDDCTEFATSGDSGATVFMMDTPGEIYPIAVYKGGQRSHDDFEEYSWATPLTPEVMAAYRAASNDKCFKVGGSPLTTVEESVQKTLGMIAADLDLHSEIADQIRDLSIIGAEEVKGVGDTQIVLVWVRCNLHKKVQELQPFLIREFERLANTHVFFVAKRTILGAQYAKRAHKPHPQSHTRTSVRDAMLEDVVYPFRISGKRTLVSSGAKSLQVSLEPRGRSLEAEQRLRSFACVFKKIAGWNASFKFDRE